jgi:hypothetical protein
MMKPTGPALWMNSWGVIWATFLKGYTGGNSPAVNIIEGKDDFRIEGLPRG